MRSFRSSVAPYLHLQGISFHSHVSTPFYRNLYRTVQVLPNPQDDSDTDDDYYIPTPPDVRVDEDSIDELIRDEESEEEEGETHPRRIRQPPPWHRDFDMSQ